MTGTNENYIHEEIKSRLNPEKSYYHSVLKLLPFHLLTGNVENKFYNIILLVSYGYEIWSLTLRKGYKFCLRTGC